MGANRKTTEEEIADLRAATREAHEAIKGLKEWIKEARKVIPEIETTARKHVDEHLAPVVKSETEKLTAAIDRAIIEADERVNRRFDQLTDILLGEDKRAKRTGKRSIPDLAKETVERRGPYGPSS